MDLKAKVCFAGDMGLAFGWNLGLEFGSLLEMNTGEEQERIKNESNKNKIKDKKCV